MLTKEAKHLMSLAENICICRRTICVLTLMFLLLSADGRTGTSSKLHLVASCCILLHAYLAFTHVLS